VRNVVKLWREAGHATTLVEAGLSLLTAAEAAAVTTTAPLAAEAAAVTTVTAVTATVSA
jgi:hypothetical protein